MTSNWGFGLVLGVLFAGGWAATDALANPSDRQRFQRAMQLVASDTESLVCASDECAVPAADRTLLVFFSPRDCAIGLYQTAVLDSLFRHAAAEGLAVLGIARDMDTGDARRFVTASGISYPVYVGGERFEDLFGKRKPRDLNSPVAVLVDGYGAVLDTHTAGGSILSHHEYAAELMHMVGGTR